MEELDPQAARAVLESFLTLAGGTVAATIIAGIIQVAKSVGAFGKWLENGHEAIFAFGLSIALIAYTVFALALPLDAIALFGYFLAWIGLAKLVGAAYDTAKDAGLAGKGT